jgi:hypothetical protein
MKKNNKQSLYETIQQMPMAGNMPINGQAMLPDGKTSVIPAAIEFQPNVVNRTHLPTQAAAAASMAAASGRFSNPASSTESEEENMDHENDETDEEENKEHMEESTKQQFRDAIISLLGEENVSADLVDSLEAVFEAAVQDRVEKNVSIVLEEVDETVKNYLSNVTNNLVEKVDDYLEYVVEEWMTDNAVAVEQGIKTQIAENFIGGLKNLFENHYIDVPTEKYNVLDELYAQNKELQVALNQSINENINLKKEVSLTECAGVFVAETRDLADTQIAKLQSLMENVSFNSVDEYRNKLTSIKNNYLTSARPAAPRKVITEEQTFSKVNEVPGTLVEGYISALGRLNKKV